MSKRLAVEPYLNLEELARHYRQDKNVVERDHYQLVWLLVQGRTTNEVREVTGYSVNWIQILARCYNQLGPAGPGDQRHENTGSETLLNDVQQAQLWQALQGSVSDGGLWS